jgi:protein TonB
LAIATVPLSGPALTEALAVSAPAVEENRKRGETKEGRIEVSDEVNVRIKLVKRVNPVYPREAKEKGITGTVVCRITIAETGKVTDVEVRRSPDQLLTESAVDAVRQWEYEPPQKNGEPVTAISDVTIRYELKQ